MTHDYRSTVNSLFMCLCPNGYSFFIFCKQLYIYSHSIFFQYIFTMQCVWVCVCRLRFATYYIYILIKNVSSGTVYVWSWCVLYFTCYFSQPLQVVLSMCSWSEHITQHLLNTNVITAAPVITFHLRLTVSCTLVCLLHVPFIHVFFRMEETGFPSVAEKKTTQSQTCFYSNAL